MHEMSVAIALLERALEEAQRAGLRNVTRVQVELGALQAVEPDLLREAFSAAAIGGPAEGSLLEVTMRPAEARCQACGQAFRPTYRDYACPACGRAESQVTAGRDLLLLALSGEAEEEGAAP